MLKEHETAIEEVLEALIYYLYNSTEELKTVDYEEVAEATETLKRIYNEI